ncbi:MAG: hypothetical protein KH026_12450 [Clostridium sp.]|nr:hypothetical protein [Clostridium sp.]
MSHWRYNNYVNEVCNFDIFFENQRVFFNNIIIVNTMRKTIKRVFSVVLAATVAVSGVSVKCDGKTVSGMKAVAAGQLEKKEDPNKYRISIYNRVGNKQNGDKTAGYPASYGKKFKFKKSISVTFKLTIK